MGENKHTETPYKISKGKKDEYFIVGKAPHDLIALTFGTNKKANAERIVHCCNNFDQVVEMLKELHNNTTKLISTHLDEEVRKTLKNAKQ